MISLHDNIRNAILASLEVKGENEIVQLNNALRLLAKHRCVLIQNTFIKVSRHPSTPPTLRPAALAQGGHVNAR